MSIEAKQSDDGKEIMLFENSELVFTLDQKFVDELHAQMEKWYWFLNVMIGTAAITFAQASLGTPQPPLNASISLVWLGLLYFAGLKYYFPPNMDILRRKTNRSVRELRKIFEKGYLSIPTIAFKVPFFALGYGYLAFIASLWLSPMQEVMVGGSELGAVFLPESCSCVKPQP